jgi:hypothetical protein
MLYSIVLRCTMFWFIHSVLLLFIYYSILRVKATEIYERISVVELFMKHTFERKSSEERRMIECPHANYVTSL